MSTHIRYCPIPGAYGVAQLNVEATLKGIDDPKAHEAAQGLGTTKCIIYCCTALQLPFPQDPSCKYRVYLVGPGPRPDDPGRYSTSDMCIPIYPCVDHPTNRPAVRPSGPFPFSNCYHWSGLGMERRVRVAIRAYTEYDEGKVAKLPGIEHIRMERMFSEDYANSAAAMRAAEMARKALEASVQNVGAEEKSQAAMDKEGGDVEKTTNSESTDDMEDIAGLEIYGLTYRADDELLPVIDVSLDIGAQFPDESDIPSPLDFIEEYDRLVRIVRAARGPSARKTMVRHLAPVAACVGVENPEMRPTSFWKRIGRWTRTVLCFQ